MNPTPESFHPTEPDPVPTGSPHEIRRRQRRQANCPRIRPILLAYLSRELGDARSRLVREHLQHCPPCRREAAATQRLCDAIRRADPAPLAPRRLSDARLRRLSRALRHPVLDWIIAHHVRFSLLCALLVLAAILAWLLTRRDPPPLRDFPARLLRHAPPDPPPEPLLPERRPLPPDSVPATLYDPDDAP